MPVKYCTAEEAQIEGRGAARGYKAAAGGRTAGAADAAVSAQWTKPAPIPAKTPPPPATHALQHAPHAVASAHSTMARSGTAAASAGARATSHTASSGFMSHCVFSRRHTDSACSSMLPRQTGRQQARAQAYPEQRFHEALLPQGVGGEEERAPISREQIETAEAVAAAAAAAAVVRAAVAPPQFQAATSSHSPAISCCRNFNRTVPRLHTLRQLTTGAS